MSNESPLTLILVFSPFIIFAAGLFSVWVYDCLPGPKARPVKATQSAPAAKASAAQMDLRADRNSRAA